MLTRIEYNGITGYGEASMPPYLGESQETASRFLSKVDLSTFSDPFQIEDILDYTDQIDEGNRAAKASVDIALHDLVGKLIGQPWHRLWGLNPGLTPNTSFTIGIDTAEVVRQKVNEVGKSLFRFPQGVLNFNPLRNIFDDYLSSRLAKIGD